MKQSFNIRQSCQIFVPDRDSDKWWYLLHDKMIEFTCNNEKDIN